MTDRTDEGEVRLLGCPFCGGEAQPALLQGGGLEWAQVECVEQGCGAIGPTPATEAEAITAWNTRAHASEDRPRLPVVSLGEVEKHWGEGKDGPD